MSHIRSALLWGKRGLRIVRLLLSDPRQARHLSKWVHSLRSNTVDLRIPWLPYDAIEDIERELTTSREVFEFGGGGSTLWFADRASSVTTIEHDQEWFEVLQRTTAPFTHVTVQHRSADQAYDRYVASIGEVPDQSIGVVVVDGRERVRCLEASMTKVAPGGLLILDDSDRDRYHRAHEIAAGWPSITYRGFAPAKIDVGVTTIWKRPQAAPQR